MKGSGYKSYSLGMIILLITATITPVFGEVTSIQTDHESFYKGDQIKFSGTVEEESIGLVTIVIRDINDEFVMLAQAIINHDDTFEETIKIGERFSEHGMYNATGFILNMTKGITTEFGVSLNGVPIILEEIADKSILEEPVINEKISVEKETEPKVKDAIKDNSIADFVDPSEDPQYYIDRYYNEVAYKSWFDRNYPALSIEEAVGYTDSIKEIKSTVQEIIDNEIIPEAQALSIAEPIQQKNNPSSFRILAMFLQP